MNRDIFKRPNRMVHKFGELEEQNDPLGRRTFDPQFPVRPDQRRSGPITVQTHGENSYFNEPRSGISKPNGRQASIEGPAPDNAQAIGFPIPMSTKKRKQPC